MSECERCKNQGVSQKATIEIQFPHMDSNVWLPYCEDCYAWHVEMADDTNQHEMEKFDGLYGLVTWKERKPKVR